MTDLADKLWARTQRSEGCWVWTGPLNGIGYGKLTVASGRRGGRKFYVHRLSWELEHGPIPAGMVVMHTCDNPPCVRPDHLRLGTMADNSADMVAKGRSLKGRLRATHCPAGHDYEVYGRIWGRKQQRACSACAARRNAERKARQAA